MDRSAIESGKRSNGVTILERTATSWRSLLCVALPVLVALGPYLSPSPGAEGQLYAYRLLILVSAPVLFITYLRTKLARRTWLITGGYALLVAWSVLSLAWTPSRSAGVREFLGMALCMVGAWVAMIAVGTADSGPKRVAQGFVAGFFVVAIICYWEIVTGEHLLVIEEMWRFEGQWEIVGTFYNPNNLAAFLLACLPPLAFGLLASHRWLARVVHLAGFAMWGHLTYLTDSRLALLGGGLIVVVGGIQVLRVHRRRALPALAVGLLATALAGVVFAEEIRSGLSTVVWGEDAAQTAESDSLRVGLALNAVQQLRNTWGRGTGAGGFEEALAQDPHYSGIVTNAHNAFFELMAQYGLIGIIAIVLILALPVHLAFRRRETGNYSASVVFLGAGLGVSILVGSLMGSSVLAEPVWWLQIGALAGVMISLTERRSLG